MARSRTVDLLVGDEPGSWEAAGFSVDGDGLCRVGSVTIRLAGPADGRFLRAWSLPAADGIATMPALPKCAGPAHPNGVEAVDHLVVRSPDLALTVGAFEDLGLEVRRVRDVGGDPPIRQVFFRVGEVVLELVGPASPGDAGAMDRPARLWGLAYAVADLDATAALLGDALGSVKRAVQPGRRIATLRHRQLGMSVPTAFMDRSG